LTGGLGRDTFILGDDISEIVGLPYVKSGINDYALITDFHLNEDIIQLSQTSGYVIDQSPTGLPSGLGIFTTQLELIAIVQGVTDLSLDESYFTFVSFGRA
jgi:Ca2+-binding RTX toxin-like protein